MPRTLALRPRRSQIFSRAAEERAIADVVRNLDHLASERDLDFLSKLMFPTRGQNITTPRRVGGL